MVLNMLANGTFKVFHSNRFRIYLASLFAFTSWNFVLRVLIVEDVTRRMVLC